MRRNEFVEPGSDSPCRFPWRPERNPESTHYSVLVAKRGFAAGILRRFKPVLEEQPMPHYVVESDVAIEILHGAEPEAAAWWRAHAPHMLEPGKLFAFAVHCCRELPDGRVP